MAATPMTVSTLNAVLKQWYEYEGRICESDSYDNRLLTLVPKNYTDAYGLEWKSPLLDGQVPGGSGDYDVTYANSGAGSQVAFTGPWKEHYGMAFVEDKVMRLSKNPKGAFSPAMKVAIDSVRSHFNDVTNYQLYRSEDGAIGQLTSGTAAAGSSITAGVGTFTFSANTGFGAQQRLKVGSVVNFSAGGAIGIAAGKAGPLQTGDWTVTAIQDGQFVATPAAGAVAPTGSAYVYVKGEAQNQASGSSIVKALAGFQSWVPDDPTVALTTFKSVDRSVNTQGRAGIRVPTAVNVSVNESYITAGNAGLRFGAKSTHVFCHPTKFGELTSELQPQQRYLPSPGRVPGAGKPAVAKGIKLSKADLERFGFGALALTLGAGNDVLIIPDWACQYNISWMVDLTKFEFVTTADGWPYNRGSGFDGQDWFRQPTTKWLTELFGVGELICRDPSKQVCIVHSNQVL